VGIVHQQQEVGARIIAGTKDRAVVAAIIFALDKGISRSAAEIRTGLGRLCEQNNSKNQKKRGQTAEHISFSFA
jgi:hypothetical protein